MEGLKLYDKESNGLLSLAELSQVLVAMGKFYLSIELISSWFISKPINSLYSRAIASWCIGRDNAKHGYQRGSRWHDQLRW